MKPCAFEIVGLETAVGLAITKLVEPGILTPLEMARAMSAAPAKAFDLMDQYGDGKIAEGNPADITIINPSEEWIVDRRKFASKGTNTPFDGWKLRGRVKWTICEGEIVYRDEKQNETTRKHGGTSI
jgi:dihydroorotase